MIRTTLLAAVCIALAACGAPKRGDGSNSGNGDGGPGSSGPGVCPSCSSDNSAVIDCDGNATACPADQACSMGTCQDPCMAASANHSSVGCEYYAVDMDAAAGPPHDACFAVFVANTSRTAVHIQTEWNGQAIDLSKFAKLPVGTGTSLTYGTYDPAAGLPPGQVAILFLAYFPRPFPDLNVACPVPAAIGDDAQISGTGIGHAFHLTTDFPVVAYQMLPYGGGKAAATGASLLLPVTAWGTNYTAVSAYDLLPSQLPPIPINTGGPSHNYVAATEGTTVTIVPTNDISAGANGLVAGPKNQPYSVTLHAGDYMQLTQSIPLSGSTVTSDKPIGAFGGHQIMSIDRCCGDHGEQMLAPVHALGSLYVGAPHADRTGPESRLYRFYGAVDGTQLTYDPPNVGPATIDKGQLVEIRASSPFVVSSQDTDHPFSAFTYMTGGGDPNGSGAAYGPSTGDPDFVRLVPPLQYLSHYVFFTDPTYPITFLTVVRQQKNGQFADVKLDCLGAPVGGWTPVGTGGQYEIAFVQLVADWIGQAGCDNGVHVMDSDTPFGVWVWGWGNLATHTEAVSYGYPAGENVESINNVILQ